MANFDEHIEHSKKNLEYLSQINLLINSRWDWQVTVCFYSALHLMNAHIARKTSKNYLSHSQVDVVLNPFNQLSLGRIDESTYLSYTKLCHLSRRSRYLLNETFEKSDDIHIASTTHETHLKKAIYHLDIVIDYISTNYDIQFGKIEINSADLRGRTFKYFEIVN
ncbi:hypothetical protein QQY79_01565 [Flavobacterium tructae]|uniref:hypothetical protein n=1 Tax=Flavobacterium tructae TaxID=1114873 RepID=UPI002551E700|nr:hypothetical protein [Flavobacterium tructae]MDL2141193.1 hypothetical protein [Flavobacterium tructae]